MRDDSDEESDSLSLASVNGQSGRPLGLGAAESLPAAAAGDGSVDEGTLRLKRLMDKREQMYDIYNKMYDKYNQAARTAVDAIR